MTKPSSATRHHQWSPFYKQFRDTTMQYGLWMDKHEREVALFIFQRTRVYGENMKHIPLRQFIQGVWNAKDGCVCPRLRMNKEALLAALKHLEMKQIIEVDRCHHTNHYALLPYDRAKEADMLTYIAEYQPTLLRAIATELRLNCHRLAPVMVDVLQKIEEHERERLNGEQPNCPAIRNMRNKKGSGSNPPLVPMKAYPGSKPNLRVDRKLLLGRKTNSFPAQSAGNAGCHLNQLKRTPLRIFRSRTRAEA
jgi:hypothetical protein